MSLVTWRPLEHQLSFKREVDRLFNSFLGDEGALTTKSHWMPAADVSETDDEVVIQMDIPGMELKDIRVAISGDFLNVTGERKEEREEEKKQFYSIERRAGMFEKLIPIPSAIDQNKIHAEYEKGVLEVHLPRKPEAKPHKIEVTSR